MVGVNESTLRYWETAVPQLKPKTLTTNKVRQYTEKDIEEFKIAAARNYLRENRQSVDKSAEVIDTLIGIRDQLKELKQHLDSLV